MVMADKKEGKINSVGIILDGNRRWAKANGLPSLEGHRRGYNKLRELSDWTEEKGIEYVTVYAFSTENWNRSKEEVMYLMDLFRILLKKDLPEFHKKGKRLRFIGDLKRLAPDLQEGIKKAEELTKNNTRGTLCACISYGGRGEIVNATREMIKKGMKPEDVTEESFIKNLYAPDIPDPELIIRTGGEMRLSNFLTWQSIYSEFFFPKKFWPEFEKEDFFAILEEFATRKRNHGK
ncbi:MAG: polyprenyl diphosphate synthase [Candidatus Pacebacteria bacterium]|nr:polyprenyl diphosphate synthase [Candidatus Paceibacterota bacterium]